jgi:hypothetical protein
MKWLDHGQSKGFQQEFSTSQFHFVLFISEFMTMLKLML